MGLKDNFLLIAFSNSYLDIDNIPVKLDSAGPKILILFMLLISELSKI